MRFSKLYLKTLKESPKEAEVISHQLLLRAGMIKKLASGIYSYLPLGKITLNKIEKIIREELDNAGCQEILMPVLQPAELWKESGRWLKMGEEMMRMQDRHNRDFVLGPTHEEVITDIIRNDIKSYKDLPINLYQIQTKFRDERRPRFGLMRGREFLMKDAYSFHTSEEDLDREYHNMYKAYERIFTRCGLNFRPVEADSGAIGGSHTHEFHVLAESGEDDILYCNKCDYAANSEKAVSNIELTQNDEAEKELTLIDTKNTSSIEDVAKFLNVDITKTVKAMMFKSILETETKYYMALIRGDYEVNEIKLKNAVNSPVELELITDEEFEKLSITKGYCGALKNISEDIYVVADETIKPMKNMVIGANIKDKHYINANINRDLKINKFYDIRMVKSGEPCPHCDGTLEIARGIEVGQVFKLGTGYAEALGAKYLDKNGKLQVMTMGCYGIGVSRTMASAIEQNYDEYGIIWPVSIAPFIVNIIPANMKNQTQVDLAEKLYKNFSETNIDTIIDDRNERLGFKMKDSDLIGLPIKIVVGKKSDEDIVEIKLRKTGETIEISANEVINKVRELIKTL
ncbi:prolyl-tRNA synthetase [Hypnocyclicus thermotrophus]|uniref:Proline--tRNA ligase n=1 Tax=Hypnocyclicus thermotrophus TaxID=1627895 RepID=A0AA46DX67_9FUSO|nr:proline--tRNA ligase [Hypnocyclicus thermotrophus]TDT67843.1 prolyl-tRNA synthetase [Hypnocyclicus thermotrophus]